MNLHDDQPTTAAQRFYGVHQGEHLLRDSDRLIDRCAQHLADTLGIPYRTAMEIATQVRAGIDADGPPPLVMRSNAG